MARQAWPGLLALLLAGCTAGATSGVDVAALPARSAMLAFSPVPPLPPDPTNPVADDPRAAALGRRLFFDAGYSAGGRFSCASCHVPARSFADGKRLAEAIGVGTRNTPSLLYAGHQRWQGWGGRGDSLWCQALAAMQNPLELGATQLGIARHTLAVAGPAYAELFGAPPATADWPATGGPGSPAYDGLSAEQRQAVATACARTGQLLAAYVRKLEPGPSAFDRYVAGDDTAIGPDARAGFGVFNGKARCAECHGGPMFTDGGFHNLALPQPAGHFDNGRSSDLAALRADPFRGDGDYAASAEALPADDPDDVGRFRTPTLRNVTRTGPYWHAGSFQGLDAVLDLDLAGGGTSTGHHFPGHADPKLQPVGLTADERRQLLAFLASLEAGPVPEPWASAP